MSSRIVIHRTATTTKTTEGGFSFSQEMIPALDGKEQVSPQIRAYRQRAWEHFQLLPLPTTDLEAWRRTDISAMPISSFRSLEEAKSQRIAYPSIPEKLLVPLAGEEYAGQVILTPQGTQVRLDENLANQGIIFTDLLNAERRHADILMRVMGKVIATDEGKFAAMAAAFARQGVFVYIPAGVTVEQPLHSILWGPGSSLAYFSHIVVFVGENASVTFVHEAASPTEIQGDSLHAGLVEILVEKHGNLKFVELQSWGEHVWNFSHERAEVHVGAQLDWVFGAIGSRLTKNFSDINLVGEGAVGKMSGFYFADGEQHLDHDTQQNHLAAHTTSDLLYKGALKDRSRSVWQGMIYVAPGAQRTDGYQANRNLILNPKARADSIPGLEIMADDVRCTHGATVGKIDPEQLFYLRSRGIPQLEAEKLIVTGFFEPIMERIPFEGVRERFKRAIVEKITGEKSPEA